MVQTGRLSLRPAAGLRSQWPQWPAWRSYPRAAVQWAQAVPRTILCSWVTQQPHLHDGTELGLVLHLLLSDSPLHAGQHGRPEEVPPVVMQRPEKELEELGLHVRGRALRTHEHTRSALSSAAQGATLASALPWHQAVRDAM